MIYSGKILIDNEEAVKIRKALKEWRVQDEEDVIVNTASFPEEDAKVEVRCIGCKAEYNKDDSRSVWNKPSRVEAVLIKNGEEVDRIRPEDNSFDITGFSSHAPNGYFGEWHLEGGKGDTYFVHVEEKSPAQGLETKKKTPAECKLSDIMELFNKKVEWPESKDAWWPYCIYESVEEIGPLCRVIFYSHQGDVIEFAKVFTKKEFLNTPTEDLLVQLLEEPVWLGDFGNRMWLNKTVEKDTNGKYVTQGSWDVQPNRKTSLYAVRTSTFAGDVQVDKFEYLDTALKFVEDNLEKDLDYFTEMTGIYAIGKKRVWSPDRASAFTVIPDDGEEKYVIKWRII